MDDVFQTVLKVLDTLIKFEPIVTRSIDDLKMFGSVLYKQFTGAELSEMESKDLSDAVDAMFERFMRTLPPAQPGDPDYVKPA